VSLGSAHLHSMQHTSTACSQATLWMDWTCALPAWTCACAKLLYGWTGHAPVPALDMCLCQAALWMDWTCACASTGHALVPALDMHLCQHWTCACAKLLNIRTGHAPVAANACVLHLSKTASAADLEGGAGQGFACNRGPYVIQWIPCPLSIYDSSDGWGCGLDGKGTRHHCKRIWTWLSGARSNVTNNPWPGRAFPRRWCIPTTLVLGSLAKLGQACVPVCVLVCAVLDPAMQKSLSGLLRVSWSVELTSFERLVLQVSVRVSYMEGVRAPTD